MRLVGIGLLVTVLTGCSVERYGDATAYRPDSPDIIEVQVPENALFISQQYFRGPNEDNFQHNGMDVWGTPKTPILAAADGVVVESRHEPLYGHRVRINHGADANGQHFVSQYFHLTRRSVEVGQKVKRGDVLGTMGSTGLLGSAVHLHFEVLVGREGRRMRPRDPHYFWLAGKGIVTCFEDGARYPIGPPRFTYPVKCR